MGALCIDLDFKINNSGLFYTVLRDIGIFMIEVGYLCFSELCDLGGLNISVGRGKAIKAL